MPIGDIVVLVLVLLSVGCGRCGGGSLPPRNVVR